MTRPRRRIRGVMVGIIGGILLSYIAGNKQLPQETDIARPDDITSIQARARSVVMARHAAGPFHWPYGSSFEILPGAARMTRPWHAACCCAPARQPGLEPGGLD